MPDGYNPVDRGPCPVGVRTFRLVDGRRGGRTLPVEVWYPAAPHHAGDDLDPALQDLFEIEGFRGLGRPQPAVRDAAPDTARRHPVVLFSHGNSGLRQQSTFYTTHLASHGYVVIAPDHTGNTVGAHFAMKPREIVRVQIEAQHFRPEDMVFVLDEALDPGSRMGGFLGPLIDRDRIGITGHSYGGYTTVVTSARDRRIRAAVPLAPVGIFGPGDFNPLETANLYADRLNYGRDVPTLILAAERDSLCVLDGIRRLVDAMPVTTALAVIARTDHMHFCDDGMSTHRMGERFTRLLFGGMKVPRFAPAHELDPIETVEPCVRSMGVAHFDAELKELQKAREWLEHEHFFGDLEADVRFDRKKRGNP